jgi:hypothetical protein
VCIEAWGVASNQSAVTTSPQDGVTFVRTRPKYFFLLAFTRGGFDSQLTLNCLGLLFRGKGLSAVKVRPIQSNLCFFSLDKKAHVFERACIVAKKGAKGPIFEEDMPPLKRTPFSGPVNRIPVIRYFEVRDIFFTFFTSKNTR